MKFDPAKPLDRALDDAAALASMVSSMMLLVSNEATSASPVVQDSLNGCIELAEHLGEYVSSIGESVTKGALGARVAPPPPQLGTLLPKIVRGASAIGKATGMSAGQVTHLHNRRQIPTFTVEGCPCALSSSLDEWKRYVALGVITPKA